MLANILVTDKYAGVAGDILVTDKYAGVAGVI
jgi:hypothetical protein